MTICSREAVPFDHRVEVVAAAIRVEAPRELDRAQHLRAEGPAKARKLVLEEPVVEARVVCDEYAPGEAGRDFARDLAESRRSGDHRVSDSGQGLDRRRDAALGVEQR